jgi:hypothetical protein
MSVRRGAPRMPLRPTAWERVPADVGVIVCLGCARTTTTPRAEGWRRRPDRIGRWDHRCPKCTAEVQAADRVRRGR